MSPAIIALQQQYRGQRKAENIARLQLLQSTAVRPHAAVLKAGAKIKTELDLPKQHQKSKSTNAPKPVKGSKGAGRHVRPQSKWAQYEDQSEDTDGQEEAAEPHSDETNSAKTVAKSGKTVATVTDKRMRTSKKKGTRWQYQLTWSGKKGNGAAWMPTWVDEDDVPLTAEQLIVEYDARIAEGERRLLEETKASEMQPTVANIYQRLVAENSGAGQWRKAQLWSVAEHEYAQLQPLSRLRSHNK